MAKISSKKSCFTFCSKKCIPMSWKRTKQQFEITAGSVFNRSLMWWKQGLELQVCFSISEILLQWKAISTTLLIFHKNTLVSFYMLFSLPSLKSLPYIVWFLFAWFGGCETKNPFINSLTEAVNMSDTKI